MCLHAHAREPPVSMPCRYASVSAALAILIVGSCAVAVCAFVVRSHEPVSVCFSVSFCLSL